MRFALIATAAAAAVAVPLAINASAPQMSGEQFLSAVRCAAYQDVIGAAASEVKYELNAEVRRQPAETAALAYAEVAEVAREARGSDATVLTQHAAACAGANLASGPDSHTDT